MAENKSGKWPEGEKDDRASQDLEVFQVRARDPRRSKESGGRFVLPSWLKIPQDIATRRLLLTVILALLAALVCFLFYNSTHTFDEARVVASVTLDDIDGTQYAMLGNRLVKYSPDGVFCVTKSNELKWSAAYTMQTPVSDVCENTMVIAEQQGTLVYVINQDGVLGSFDTGLPILKATVSRQGVTALLLADGEVTWINLYDTAGKPLASVKTTVSESGYPLDVAITPNAKQMLVSFLKPAGSMLESSIAFYDFSSSEDADAAHLIDTITYERRVFPDVYYAGDDKPVAVSDAGFCVYSVGRTARETTSVETDREIVSIFHDDGNIGFVFHSEETDVKYEMEVYGYNGKRAMNTKFSFEYAGVRMEDGEILLYDARNLNIYRTSGKQKLHTTYDREVVYFTGISGFRRYLVATDGTLDQIRIQ